METDQRPKVLINGKLYPVAYGKMRPKPGTKIVHKKGHTKVFNKKLGCYVDDYPLDRYLIKNSYKVICYIQEDENLYAIRVQESLRV